MSTLFNLRIPVKEKPVTHHPWDATIKDVYAPLIKTAHNSAKNLQYPKKTEKMPNKERFRFTIIGNRVTKEFIYCANLVKGMHKYRQKEFESPIIRGVTSLEWPLVWNELKIEHGDLAYCLKSQVAVLMNNKIIGGEPELRELIESKYVYHLCLDYYKESVDQFAGFVKSSGRPCAYMHISVDSQHIGTMIFMLYADIVPHTSENFLRLCRTRRGGYSGTTIHRIVKDGWIQCGGYGLKSTNLSCENFIIPHDKRGVLCMANNGRHNDCSTQFFVLLQPAPWMAYKYVAFGQLIDGDATLKQIENVPTWHESPTVDIVIHKAGILNLDCHDIVINKGTNEYIQGHIDDLVALGDLFIEMLMEKVFLEIEFRRVSRFRQLGEGVEEEMKGLHETKRFMRNKEDIQKQIEKSQAGNEYENNEFDVEVYEYEPEEYSYKRASPLRSPSFVRPEIPYYLPMMDVPYPGEVESTYDLKKFLRGDYCLESDIDKDAPKRPILRPRESFPSSLFNVQDEESEEASEQSLDSDDEKEIRKYLKLHADRVSFGGGVIKTIARGDGKMNLFESARKSELITDDELRRLRLASVDRRQSSPPAAVAAPTANADRKVLISAPDNEKESLIKIKRRQTGFVRPINLEKIQAIAQSSSHLVEEESHLSRKVRIDPAAVPCGVAQGRNRRQTGFVRATEPEDSDTEVHRRSVLVRLYDDVSKDEAGPTLKDYRPMSETQKNNFPLLTYSPNTNIRSEESNKEKYHRHSITVENDSFDNLMSMQHGKKCARKISSDYVNTIDQAERRGENSIRSIEFAKTRPSMSVLEYQKKNQKYQEEMVRSKIHTVMMPVKDFDDKSSVGGIRLPGDTPLYSLSES